MTFINPKSKNS